MTKALTVITTLIALSLPLSSRAVPVIDPGLGGDDNGPDTILDGSRRPNGPNFAEDGLWVADDFKLTMSQELGRVTFWAYLQTGATWEGNILNYRIALNDDSTGTDLPAAATIAAGSVSARTDTPGSIPYRINDQAEYYLNQYSFDLGGLGVSSEVIYWLALKAGVASGGDDPTSTNLLWAYNAQTGGAVVSGDGNTWFANFTAGGTAFEFQAPVPATLYLFAAGLLGFRMFNRAPKARSQQTW